MRNLIVGLVHNLIITAGVIVVAGIVSAAWLLAKIYEWGAFIGTLKSVSGM